MTGNISPLRQRMIEDMSVCNFDPHTQSCYIRAMNKLAAFLGCSPDQVRHFVLDPVLSDGPKGGLFGIRFD